MNLRNTIAKYFVRRLIETPEGRAHLLNQIAEGEEQGEARLFDEAIGLVEDERLKKMIRRHAEDEIRHGEMFRACIARNGVEVGPVPPHLDVLSQLDEALGGFFERGITSAEQLMEAFAILQVIEERALDQFSMYAEVFEGAGDPETAETFRLVEKDEERHLKYCRAIALRYAPSEAAYDAEVERIREVEARVFRTTQSNNVDHILENDLAPSLSARLFFRAMRALSTRVDELPYTQFKAPAWQHA